MEANIINDLINVLDQETRVYDDILSISKNKTGIIVEGKVTELESIVKLEQSLVLKMSRLEGLREELVQNLSDQLNIKPSEITISELMKHAKSAEVHRLKTCQDNMANVVTELKNSNDMNTKLIKNSLDYIEFSINLLAGVSAAGNNYGNSGHISSSKKRNTFDMKL